MCDHQSYKGTPAPRNNREPTQVTMLLTHIINADLFLILISLITIIITQKQSVISHKRIGGQWTQVPESQSTGPGDSTVGRAAGKRLLQGPSLEPGWLWGRASSSTTVRRSWCGAQLSQQRSEPTSVYTLLRVLHSTSLGLFISVLGPLIPQGISDGLILGYSTSTDVSVQVTCAGILNTPTCQAWLR